MQRFYCNCGHEIFFENSYCTACDRSLGYDPMDGCMHTLEVLANNNWQVVGQDRVVRYCANRENHGICNAIVADNDTQVLCLACGLNRTIPDLGKEPNLQRWAKLEQAKRRLIYGLRSLGLPLAAPVAGFPRGLSFDFLEDKRSNPDAPDEFVTTGHYEGVITINVLEADDVQRVWQRELSSERYRTLLGHLRHEVGHYYFELLVKELNEFQQLFGDHTRPYKDALVYYYDHGPLAGWELSHISAYASAHPLEDWAECFAHYLHVADTLETAAARELIGPLTGCETIDQRLQIWDTLSVNINELNRSLGLQDAYPFVVTPMVAEKLRYVDKAIKENT